MLDGGLLVITVIAGLGAGLMSGAFYAFSSFVMSGFRRLPPADGMAAMQAVNVTAVGPGFMAGFFGTTVLSAAAAVWAIVDWREEASVLVLVGAGLYAAGVFAMTAAYHVPRNNRLAALDARTPEGTDYWAVYLREWTRWNHARAVASLLAAAAFIVAIRLA